jgi:hypothetical protein
LSTYVEQWTHDNPTPRAKDADATTGSNAQQQELWQLLHTLADAGTPNVFQFFVLCLWLALVDVAELVVSGEVEQDSDPGDSDDDMPNMGNGKQRGSAST